MSIKRYPWKHLLCITLCIGGSMRHVLRTSVASFPDAVCDRLEVSGSSRSSSDTWCCFSYVCGRRERARAVSEGAWSSRANSGALRLARGAIAGQKSQRVRDHKKVRRKEKRETSVQESRQGNLLARTERQASKPNRSWAVPSSPLTTPCLRASFPKIVF